METNVPPIIHNFIGNGYTERNVQVNARIIPYVTINKGAELVAGTVGLSYAQIERLLRWLGEYQAANPEYDYE